MVLETVDDSYCYNCRQSQGGEGKEVLGFCEGVEDPEEVSNEGERRRLYQAWALLVFCVGVVVLTLVSCLCLRPPDPLFLSL